MVKIFSSNGQDQDILARTWQWLERIEQSTLRRWLRIHLFVLALFVALLFWFTPFPDESAAYFWLPFAFGLPAAVHFFVVATLTVDETWTEERTLDVKIRSYDLGHMEDIRERHEDLHPSAINKIELDRLSEEDDDQEVLTSASKNNASKNQSANK